LFVVAIGITSLLFSVTVASAQETRVETIRQAQADRQPQLTPPRPNTVERVIDQVEDWGLLDGTPLGVYPWFGSVYPGGGFAGGAGYRKPFGDDGGLNMFAGYSLSTFSRAEADLSLPTFANNRARVTISGRYVDAPNVRYYGVGNSSGQADATRFGLAPTSGGARLDVDIGRYLTIGGGVEYIHVNTSEGKTEPSIETRFSPANTPGLELAQFDYIKNSAHAAFDWRRQPGYTGSGGLYRVQFDDIRDRHHTPYSFKSLEAEVVQLIPILHANWVIALRGLATVTDVDATSAVPFFLLPSLGGASTLRGYPDFRFRDRNRLLTTAELRWTPARFMDMAIFYDAGTVTSKRGDLALDDVKESYGVGMRLIGVRRYIFSVQAAHSREHNVRLMVSAGGGF
jgi:outer membrane protein assembly factor BamA